MRLTVVLVATLLSFGVEPVALAGGFAGTTVSMGHYVPSEAVAFDGPYNVLVVSGGADGASPDRKVLSPFLGCDPGYGVTVLEDSVVVDFVGSVNFTAGAPFHGLIIRNLVRPGATISIVESNPHSTMSYDGSTLKLDWQGLGIPAGATYTITFTPGNGGTGALVTPCSTLPLGVCTTCSGGATPLCTGVQLDAGLVCPAAGGIDAATGSDIKVGGVDAPTPDVSTAKADGGMDVTIVPDTRMGDLDTALVGTDSMMGGSDAKTVGADSGPRNGGLDGGSGSDLAGSNSGGSQSSKGCSCAIGGHQSSGGLTLMLLFGLLLALRRGRRD
jgi:MYXO-CTERM domain-containing protein